MKILIDGQRVIDIPVGDMLDEDGIPHSVVTSDAMSHVLDAWMDLNTNRDYRYGDPDSDGPDTIVLAWVEGDRLKMDMLEPFYTGEIILHAWSLHTLRDIFPSGMLSWGVEVGGA